MTQGEACRVRSHRPMWTVRTRNANYSAFNGGRRTPSAYSLVVCGSCNKAWRTRAQYVDRLPDQT